MRRSVRLTFRSLAQVGSEAFADAVAEVVAGTRDRALSCQTEREGADAQWRQLAALDFDPRWYRLGFDAAGELVGVSAPARNADGRSIVAFVGVAPAKRGHGYVDDLLAESTNTLTETGARVVVADADVENEPMLAAFRRAGYENFAHRYEFELPVRRQA
jgi:ribosomal protein S18 acetylase RimI-like enzyme